MGYTRRRIPDSTPHGGYTGPSVSGNAMLILESDDELEDGGEERVVLQTNVEMLRCSSVPS